MSIIAGFAVAASACGAKPDAKAAPTKNDSSSGEVAASADAAGAKGGTGTFLVADSIKPHLIAARNKHDSSSYFAAIRAGDKRLASWPAGPTRLAGSLLPENRIIAYYGNPHSKKMGVLGEYPPDQMLSMLDKTVAEWRKADPSTPVIPAIHLVTVVAQGSPGADGGWRRRENPQTIEQAYQWAKSRKGLLFLDIQAGHSTLQQELPLLLKYLQRPDVHLGIDPEFYMHYKREGVRPSAKVGQMMASDVNYVIQTLDKLVTENHLPPKILIVHRFRQDMVPDAENIRPTSHVQVVMDMDGWGPPWLKFDSYHDYIVNHPVEFTGFKLFYHNDTKSGEPILTPFEVLRLAPKPLYIQYQ
ncbi:MAG TPA: hypothetical protein VHB25_13590 [Gemmatimonadaceae bacterium]|nr:hypothetical protein [Gemmatimonadaceae bacterium]